MVKVNRYYIASERHVNCVFSRDVESSMQHAYVLTHSITEEYVHFEQAYLVIGSDPPEPYYYTDDISKARKEVHLSYEWQNEEPSRIYDGFEYDVLYTDEELDAMVVVNSTRG